MKIEMRLLLNNHTPNPHWQTDTFDLKPGDTLEVRDDHDVVVTLAAHPGKYVELDAEEMNFLRGCIECAYSEGSCGLDISELDSQRVLELFRKLGVSPTAWYYQLVVYRLNQVKYG